MGQWILQILYNLGYGQNITPFWHDIWFVVMGAVVLVCVVLPLIIAVAYLTLLERKILAWAHYRLGPNRCGWLGLLQPLCDAVKLLIKEDIVPLKVDWYTWFLAPVVAFAPMLACFLVIPYSYAEIIRYTPGLDMPNLIFKPMVAADLGIGLLFILSVSSLVVVGIFTAGIGSNNKYSMFGGVRSAGQIISYEVPIVLSLLTVVLLTGSMSMVDIVKSQKYIPPSEVNKYLDVQHFTSNVGGIIIQDWPALAEYLETTPESERGLTVQDMNQNWQDFKDRFQTQYELLHINKQKELSLAGQRLLLEYSDFNKHKGSPGLPFAIPLLIAFLVYYIAGVAETNRSPFDLPEGESEIVAGFHTEYTGIKFGLFFLGEYGNMILISAIATTCFLGGWLGPAIPGFDSIANGMGQFLYYFIWFMIKIFILVSIMVWFRATFPRLRVDQLTDFAWKVLVPVALINLLIVGYFHFSDWNLHTMGETNWILWYGNFVRPFKYPAVRLLIILIVYPILSDVLYPYRKVIQPKYLYAQILFGFGFLGYGFYSLLTGSKNIELLIQWIFYAIAIRFTLDMIRDYIRAKKQGVKFIPAVDDIESIEKDSEKGLFGEQSVH